MCYVPKAMENGFFVLLRLTIFQRTSKLMAHNKTDYLLQHCKVFLLYRYLTLFRMGLFGGCSRMGGSTSLKSVTHPTLMKLGTTIPYIRKIQKIHKSRETTLSSADLSIFHRKSAIFSISINTGIDCILMHKF